MTTKSNTLRRGNTPAEKLAEAMRLGRGYTGDLARPIEVARRGSAATLLLGPAENLRDGSDERIAELLRRLILLFEWHKVAIGDFPRLAMALAETHVPGFQFTTPRRKRGRPSKLQNALLADARKLAKDPASTDLQTLKLLEQRQRKPGRPHLLSPEGQRYLVLAADKWRKLQRANGVKRPSDAGFARHLCEEQSKLLGISVRDSTRRHYRSWVNCLSRGRKAVSKPEEK